LSLFVGSVLLAVPLTIAVMTYRSTSDPATNPFHWQDEVGMLFAGVLLLATGSMIQLRSTTIAGAFLLLVYLLTLPILLPWGKLDTAAILIMVAGGLIFGTGLLLSVYRDRLLTQVQHFEGQFPCKIRTYGEFLHYSRPN